MNQSLEFTHLDSFNHFAETSLKRALRWHPNGLQSWSPSDWFTALVGEVGEAANIVKKLNRVRDGLVGNKETPEELRAMFADELADIFIYLDLLAQSEHINLAAAVKSKFNKTSKKNNFPERL